MATLQIQKENAIKAYNQANGETKTLLVTLMPELAQQDKDRWKQWTTLEHVCREAGEDVNDYVIPANATRRQRGTILYNTLQLICEVFNMGTEISYDDANQAKWYPWGKFVPGSGFSLRDVDCARTLSNVGARLQVDSREKVEHIWKHFSHIYNDFWQGK